VNLGVVRGTVVCEQRAEELVERRLVLIQPVDEAERDDGPPVVALDPLVSAAEGAFVWFVSGSDATDALDDPAQPADAVIVGLVASVRGAAG